MYYDIETLVKDFEFFKSNDNNEDKKGYHILSHVDDQDDSRKSEYEYVEMEIGTVEATDQYSKIYKDIHDGRGHDKGHGIPKHHPHDHHRHDKGHGIPKHHPHDDHHHDRGHGIPKHHPHDHHHDKGHGIPKHHPHDRHHHHDKIHVIPKHLPYIDYYDIYTPYHIGKSIIPHVKHIIKKHGIKNSSINEDALEHITDQIISTCVKHVVEIEDICLDIDRGSYSRYELLRSLVKMLAYTEINFSNDRL